MEVAVFLGARVALAHCCARQRVCCTVAAERWVGFPWQPPAGRSVGWGDKTARNILRGRVGELNMFRKVYDLGDVDQRVNYKSLTHL